jgi:hypothetical protein
MPAVPAASAAAEDAGRVPVQVQPPPPLQPQHAQPPQPPREQPSPLRSLPRRLPGVGEAVRCITLAGDFVLRVHEYHCDTCEQTFKPLATLAGCFPVCLTPPAGQVVWIEIRLLNVQKHLTSRGATFSGAQNIRLRACHAADVLPLQHFALIPKQTDGSSCGVFVLESARYLVRVRPWKRMHTMRACTRLPVR